MRVQDRAIISAFVSLVAQQDNLGDVVIRKQALDWLRDGTRQLTLLTAGMPASYLEVFDISANERQIASSNDFARRLLASKQSLLLLSPGPHVVGNSAKSLVSATVSRARLEVIRARGGVVAALGRALYGDARTRAMRMEMASARRANLYLPRDNRTADLVGGKAKRVPDLAFAERFDPTGDRDQIALSFRSDRMPSKELLLLAIERIRYAGWNPIFVTQVARDDAQHALAASELGVDAILWERRSHAEQLARVRSAYAASLGVVSDRLHALIFGVQALAYPMARSCPNIGKIPITLDGVVGFSSVGLDLSGLEPALAALSESSTSDMLRVHRDGAFNAVHEAKTQLLQLLEAGH